ncbi:hypothetical protein RhiirA1_464593 [Rhizophagus irregularis]|uniref:Uncharacterized protein n=1 Tax=Rhizophagus irregularis TaxID=588596 RepID=A0A2I1F136_9GLOM|nr:hypothetical protein RhiirA1_464593 [Rhizophagus irregularis]PKY28089.1 hypothetical protein RhiirB3_444084 [Rhizophagus irregularis]
MAEPSGISFLCISCNNETAKVSLKVISEGEINVDNQEMNNLILNSISLDENPKKDYITLNFGNVEEEILSHKFPEAWGKIQIGLICYQLTLTDHHESVLAFVNNAKCRKSTQLCVYQENENKQKQSAYEYESGLSNEKKQKFNLKNIMTTF